MKKYCIFDLDGTLVDSMGEWGKTMTDILDEEGISYPPDIVKILTPIGNVGSAKLFKEMGVKGTQEEIVARMQSYAYEAYSKRIVTKKGVKEFLLKLKRDGHILAVLTASPHITVDVCLKRNGVYDLFEKVFTVDDFKLTKSQPEIYRKAAQALGADISEITFFDDNLTALLTAKSAGLECVGVFDASSEADTARIKEECAMYLESFEDA